MKQLKVGHWYTHNSSSKHYLLLCVANNTATKHNFTPTAVYKSVDGEIFSRSAAEFCNRFTLNEQAESVTLLTIPTPKLEQFTKTANKGCWQDGCDENNPLDVDSHAGGNIDDAFWGGHECGDVEATRDFLGNVSKVQSGDINVERL